MRPGQRRLAWLLRRDSTVRIGFGVVAGDVIGALNAADELIVLALDQRNLVVVIVLALDLRNLAVPG